MPPKRAMLAANAVVGYLQASYGPAMPSDGAVQDMAEIIECYMRPELHDVEPELPRFLPLRGGPAVFPSAVEQSIRGDVFVVALSEDNLPPGRTRAMFAEYTYCQGRHEETVKARNRYDDMSEVSQVIVLQVVSSLIKKT